MSSPSRGAALMSHFGCVLLHFQAMDDILWEISDTESNQGSYTTYVTYVTQHMCMDKTFSLIFLQLKINPSSLA